MIGRTKKPLPPESIDRAAMGKPGVGSFGVRNTKGAAAPDEITRRRNAQNSLLNLSKPHLS